MRLPFGFAGKGVKGWRFASTPQLQLALEQQNAWADAVYSTAWRGVALASAMSDEFVQVLGGRQQQQEALAAAEAGAHQTEWQAQQQEEDAAAAGAQQGGGQAPAASQPAASQLPIRIRIVNRVTAQDAEEWNSSSITAAAASRTGLPVGR